MDYKKISKIITHKVNTKIKLLKKNLLKGYLPIQN